LAPFVDAATAIDVTNVSNTFISYYTYGQALALGIDLAIRERFPGKSLDDWMRAMWKRHGDIQNPYTLDDLQEELAAATGSAEFAADIFKRHIYGMAPMEYQKLLSRAGLLLRKTHAGQAWLGVPPNQLHVSDQEVEITANTLRDTPIYNAGLDKGDRILQWNGKALKTAEDIDTWLTSHKPGDHVRLKVSTRAGEKEVEVVLMENPNVEVIPFETAGQPVTEEIKTLRNAWLSSKALHPLPKLEPMP